MATFRSHLRMLRRRFFKPTLLPAVGALGIVVIAGVLADYQNTIVHQQRLRNEVVNQLSVIRAKLEGNLNSNLQLVKGLSATVAIEPEMSEGRFAALAAKLFEEHSQLRSIALAPDLVVRMSYPLVGNERAIGLNYLDRPEQAEAVLRARDTRELVLAGPVALVQGGHGFIGRFPVFVDFFGRERFWGIVAAVIDQQRLYEESGLLDPNLGIQVALAGKDATGERGAHFFGPPDVFSDSPVVADVLLPSGSWQIAAVPKQGWDAFEPGIWLVRGTIVLLGALIVVPLVVGGRLIEERQRHIRDLGSREAELRRLSRRLGLALETSQVGVWEYEIDSGALNWDDRMDEIYGLPADGSPRSYAHWADRLHPDDLERASEDFRVALEETGEYRSDYRIVTQAGVVRSIRAIGKVYKDPGTPVRIVGVNWDVSADAALNEDLKRANRLSEARYHELEATKARIEHNALHDSLTGLPNRRYLDEVLKQHAENGSGSKLALLHIDLDRFKQINDTLGHAAGDAMLVHASEVLKATIEAGDFVARIGGDEFVVVRRNEDRQVPLDELAENIIARMRQPVCYEGHECRFGVSVGIASEAVAPVDTKRLLINADIALYRAKSRGRNRFEFFSEALQAEVVRTKRLADEILHGLENSEFVPYYQLQFDARTHDVVGVEALARWNHPSEGLLVPPMFFDVAEELAVVPIIDRMILEQGLAQLARWRGDGLEVPRISVNVSARRLQDEQLIEGLRGLQIEPGSVSFELVESIFLDETDDIVLWNIDQIKDLGIDIEIDDFGTGYASIVSLLKLKPRRLKIDRQLVMPVVGSPAQRQLVASIIDIGKSLGVQVVGEGVETLEHAHVLRDLGCDILQGFALARPLAAAEATEILRGEHWRQQQPDSPPALRRLSRAQ